MTSLIAERPDSAI